MTLEEFKTRVAQRYFSGPRCPPGTPSRRGASLDQDLSQAWGTTVDDAVYWRERLRAQLRDGSFHYIAVAQRFTPPVLRTLRYLNAAMKAARFSAVELIPGRRPDPGRRTTAALRLSGWQASPQARQFNDATQAQDRPPTDGDRLMIFRGQRWRTRR